MATITRENIGLLNEKIVVKVEKGDYLPSFEKAIKDYSKKANIPGFRKGMVPVGMVKKMYGSSVFADEVIKSVEKGLSNYMETEKLEIFAQPLPLPENDASQLDMDQPSEYAFAFEVGLKPEFTVANLGNANLTRYKVSVTDEMINKEVDNLQLRNSRLTEHDIIISEENELNVTFKETDAEGNEVEGGITKNHYLSISYFSPMLRDQLIGKRIDDALEVQLSNAFEEDERLNMLVFLGLPKDDPQAADKFFKIIITGIHISEKALLNEELFKKVYPSKDILTEEDFRNEIRQDIQSQLESQSHNQLFDQIYHELLDHTHINFPEEFLKRWMVTNAEKQKTTDEVEQEFPTFVNQLKWTLILDKLIQENNIEVKPEDLREFAKNQLLGYMGGHSTDMDQPWINNYIDKMMKDKNYLQDSFHKIRTEKIFLWAETQIHPTEAEISADEFSRMLKEHKH